MYDPLIYARTVQEIHDKPLREIHKALNAVLDVAELYAEAGVGDVTLTRAREHLRMALAAVLSFRDVQPGKRKVQRLLDKRKAFGALETKWADTVDAYTYSQTQAGTFYVAEDPTITGSTLLETRQTAVLVLENRSTLGEGGLPIPGED